MPRIFDRVSLTCPPVAKMADMIRDHIPGNRCTLDYGDIDEPFYDALLSMYGRALDKVLELPEEAQQPFLERLHRIMTSSSGIGWGYHDELCDMYEDAFPEEE